MASILGLRSRELSARHLKGLQIVICSLGGNDSFWRCASRRTLATILQQDSWDTIVTLVFPTR